MVLCSYVYLWADPSTPSWKLQPTEVGSAHWISIRALLSPALKTYEYGDVAGRLARRGGCVAKSFIRLMLGKMLFAAVRLIPSESVYSSFEPGFLPAGPRKDSDWLSRPMRIKSWWLGDASESASSEGPLLLWGLTLGIISDFLELLRPETALELWTWPTFAPWDVRFTIWLMSFSFRERKLREACLSKRDVPAAIEEGLDAIALPDDRAHENGYAGSGIGGLGVGKVFGNLDHPSRTLGSSAIMVMLEGYFVLLRRAVFLALIMRVGVSSAIVLSLFRRYRRSRRP